MRTLLFGVPLCAVVSSLPAQSLLRDIDPAVDPTRSSVISSDAAANGGRVFFRASDGILGEELWVSDGTAPGTRLAYDALEGFASSQPGNLAPFGTSAVFSTVIPSAFWFTDGTPAGTVRLAANPGPPRPVAVGGAVFFTATTVAAGNELWVSDGTVAGTHLVVDLAPGPAWSFPDLLTAGPTQIWFVPRDGRIRTSDGTAAGTVEFAAGAAYGTVTELAYWNGQVVFAAHSGASSSVWISDGTPAGTTMLASGFTNWANSIRALGARFVFVAADAVHGTEMWVSDGTPAGTQMIVEIVPNPEPAPLVGPATVAGGLAFFRADDGVHGSELWATDGTAAGTHLVKDVFAGVWDSFPSWIVAAGPRVFFRANNFNYGEEVWVSDGTLAGTRLVADIRGSGGSGAFPLGAIGSDLLLCANDGVHGYEPWITDGTPAGTRLVSDLAGRPHDSTPAGFARFGARKVFAASDVTCGREPWITDGTTSGTVRLADVNPGSASSNARSFFEWKGRLWFSADDGSEGHEPWVSDGTSAGTLRFASLVPGAGNSAPLGFTPVGDHLVFAAYGPQGYELWSTDGTVAGTAMIDLDPGRASDPRQFTAFGAHVYFVASHTASGTELWRTDGTASGTTLVVELLPGPGSGRILSLTASGGRLWFTGTTIDSYLPQDLEPWVTDGTAAGTRRVLDIAAGLSSSMPTTYATFLGRTWFTVSNGFVRDLWSSDGTGAGTSAFGAGSASGDELVVAGERLFFFRMGELWSTDGTVAGTNLAYDIIPGAQASHPRELTALGPSGLVAFTAQSLPIEREVWISDGTPAGTRMLIDVWPGSRSASPTGLTRAGDHLFFAAEAPRIGVEPYVTSFADIEAGLAEILGQGCAGSNGVPEIGVVDAPLLGQSGFAITLSQAQPMAPAFLFFGFTLFPGGDLLGCVPKVMPPAIAVGTTADGVGRATLPLGVPNDPQLLGLEAYLHWLVIDPQGGFLGSLALSPVVDLVIGR